MSYTNRNERSQIPQELKSKLLGIQPGESFNVQYGNEEIANRAYRQIRAYLRKYDLDIVAAQLARGNEIRIRMNLPALDTLPYEAKSTITIGQKIKISRKKETLLIYSPKTEGIVISDVTKQENKNG